MSLWDFRRESTSVASGANTVAGIKAGSQAPVVAGGAGEMAEKRNVISTTAGWVRRENRGTRQIDQTIVAANPGGGFSYNSNTHLGKPNIAQIYVKLNANGVISANVSSNLYVVFNTPLTFKPSGNLCSITISNTIAGNAAVGHFANTVGQGRIVNANNTLIFKMAPLQAHISNTSIRATYKIPAQTITVTGMPLYNPDYGITSSANVVITGAVANNLLDGVGNRIGTFQVGRNGV